MREYDSTVPKVLLPVNGRPFAHWQLSWLASEGITSVVLSIGFKGELVREFVGDAQKWGLEVTYVEETGRLLGTGGAIRLAADRGVLDEHFFVLYGDSYLRVDLRSVEAAFRSAGLPALMTVFDNHGQWDTSNAFFDGKLVKYSKGNPGRDPKMHFIDYGLMILSRQTVMESIEPGHPSDLAELLESLSAQGLLAGYEADERFFEIGSPTGLRDLDEFLKDKRQ